MYFLIFCKLNIKARDVKRGISLKTNTSFNILYQIISYPILMFWTTAVILLEKPPKKTLLASAFYRRF